MIVNNMCNNSTLNNVNFWGSSIIINTNIELTQYTDGTNNKFKKRLKFKSNRYKRLEYNELQKIKNSRDKR